MTPEERKEYNKEYRKNNKEKIQEKRKEFYQENKEAIKEERKEYYENNIEKIKAYRETEQGIKSNRISKWKQRGVISDDFPSLYDYYINCKNCEECNVELVEGMCGNKRCLDHDHSTGLFRNVLCHSCNIRRR